MTGTSMGLSRRRSLEDVILMDVLVGHKIHANIKKLHGLAKGAFKYYVSKFSLILDSPPCVSTISSSLDPHSPKFADVILEWKVTCLMTL